MPRPQARHCRIFTIVYVPSDRAAKYSDSNLHWMNECVAVGDRILKLFEANTNEIFTVDRSVAPKHRPPEPSSFRERRRRGGR